MSTEKACGLNVKEFFVQLFYFSTVNPCRSLVILATLDGRWEKYNAKGWTEKGAQKFGRLNEQSWWEKWGEQYDGRGAVLKW